MEVYVGAWRCMGVHRGACAGAWGCIEVQRQSWCLVHGGELCRLQVEVHGGAWRCSMSVMEVHRGAWSEVDEGAWRFRCGSACRCRCMKRHEGECKKFMEIEVHRGAGASAWRCMEVNGVREGAGA